MKRIEESIAAELVYSIRLHAFERLFHNERVKAAGHFAAFVSVRNGSDALPMADPAEFSPSASREESRVWV